VPEQLGLNQYQCQSCQQAVVKQLSLKELPPILSIQLKRFEHGLSSTSKIEAKVKIPLFLDMTPHTTRAVKVRSLVQKGHSLKRQHGKIVFDSVMFCFIHSGMVFLHIIMIYSQWYAIKATWKLVIIVPFVTFEMNGFYSMIKMWSRQASRKYWIAMFTCVFTSKNT
jgi:hypothetical protein